MDFKTCKRCGEGKALSEFDRTYQRRDNLRHTCRECYYRSRMVTLRRGREDPPEDMCCEICGAEGGRSLHADHNHTTGRERGWLCMGCNTSIARLKDSPPGLVSALRYLFKHGEAVDTEGLQALLDDF